MATKMANSKNNGKLSKKRERKPRQKQPYLPGAEYMAPHSIKEINEAAEDYRIARDSRMKCGETEQEASETLLGTMLAHGLTEYEYDGKIVKVNELRKVSVRKQKAKEAETLSV